MTEMHRLENQEDDANHIDDDYHLVDYLYLNSVQLFSVQEVNGTNECTNQNIRSCNYFPDTQYAAIAYL